MAIHLTENDLQDMQLKTQPPLDLGDRINLPEQIGTGGDLNIRLCNEHTLTIRHAQLKQIVRYTALHKSNSPLVAKFYLFGASRIQTLDATDIDPYYVEIKATGREHV